MKLLIPKEHGAYAYVSFGLIAGLLLGHPGWGALLLVVAALLTFWVHEPMLVVLGQRGDRRRQEQAAEAWWSIAVLWALALVALAGALGLLEAARPWIALPFALGALTMGVVFAGAEKTTLGELIAAAALSSWLVPLAVASGAAARTALLGWQTLAAGFFIATFAVRVVIAAGKKRASTADRAWVIAFSLLVPLAFWAVELFEHAPAWLGVAVLPFTVFGVVLAVAPPHARNLKRIGWGLVAASALTTAGLVATLR